MRYVLLDHTLRPWPCSTMKRYVLPLHHFVEIQTIKAIRQSFLNLVLLLGELLAYLQVPLTLHLRASVWSVVAELVLRF